MSLSLFPPELGGCILALAAVLGLVMGSFLTCLADRLVRKESILKGRSHCDACGRTLGALDLIPVLSWLLLRGKCRYCGAKVPLRCPVVEAMTGGVYASLVAVYGLTWECLGLLVLASCLMAAALVDLDIQEVPNGLVLTAIGAFAVTSVAHSLTEWRPLPAPWGLGTALLNAGAVVLPLLLLVLLADKVLGRETMGGGDLKLLFAIGLFFSWQENLLLLILSCVVGLVLAAILVKAKPGVPFPFAPAIALATWPVALWGSRFIHWYLSLFRY